MNLQIFHIIFAIACNAILYGVFALVGPPDPKGIKFFIFSFGYGCINAIIAIVILIIRCSPKKLIHTWVIFGNAIFIYYLYELIKNAAVGDLLNFNSLHVIIAAGSVLFFILVAKSIIFWINPKNRESTLSANSK